jgi:rhodanese-related sulfurtransferase
VIVQGLRQLACLLALALAPAVISGVIQLKFTDRTAVDGEVDAAVARSWGDKVIWVDARPRGRFAESHIPGAVLLNEDEWDRLVPAFLDAWEPEKLVVVYCDGGSCDASHSVARRLRGALQLQNVHVLKGGWAAWQQK